MGTAAFIEAVFHKKIIKKLILPDELLLPK